MTDSPNGSAPRGRGRPRLDPSDDRRVVEQVRTTAYRSALWRSAAERLGMTLSEWMRYRLDEAAVLDLEE